MTNQLLEIEEVENPHPTFVSCVMANLINDHLMPMASLINNMCTCPQYLLLTKNVALSCPINIITHMSLLTQTCPQDSCYSGNKECGKEKEDSRLFTALTKSRQIGFALIYLSVNGSLSQMRRNKHRNKVNNASFVLSRGLPKSAFVWHLLQS